MLLVTQHVNELITYLIQSVVGGDRDGVGVHHQPLPQQCEQTVRVHYLHLPPSGNTHTPFIRQFMTVESDIDCHRPDAGLILAGGTMWPCQL